MALFCTKTINLTKLAHFKPQSDNRLLSLSILNTCQKKEQEDDERPIKFSTSKAAKWKAEISRTGIAKPAPWFQPYVISLSLAVFMSYFFYFREESDVDREFDKTLYDRITGLEEKQLEIVLKHNLENNLPVQDVKKRLVELRQQT